MQKYDVQVLGQNLNALCEVFDKKPVPLKALEVWFDTLKEFQTQHVMDAVIGWPKTNNRFPTPADIWKQVRERSGRDIERKAEEAKQEFHPGGRDQKNPGDQTGSRTPARALDRALQKDQEPRAERSLLEIGWNGR
jgi:hypothetical protein